VSFYDIADQLDALAKQLRDSADQAALGNYTVGIPPEPEPVPKTEDKAKK
jgi:hypothetical protein